jgi:hypothetical protein
MKLLTLFILTLVAACDPYGFGFKHNPAYVLDTAFKAVSNLDEKSFLEVSGKEALCLYGNPEGITYLRERLNVDTTNVKINPYALYSKHHEAPEFVGYWSYYTERYMVEILDKRNNGLLIGAVVDCHYGTDGNRNDNLKNLPSKKYKRKECKLTKIIPKTFEALPITHRCQIFKIGL